MQSENHTSAQKFYIGKWGGVIEEKYLSQTRNKGNAAYNTSYYYGS